MPGGRILLYLLSDKVLCPIGACAFKSDHRTAEADDVVITAPVGETVCGTRQPGGTQIGTAADQLGNVFIRAVREGVQHHAAFGHKGAQKTDLFRCQLPSAEDSGRFPNLG